MNILSLRLVQWLYGVVDEKWLSSQTNLDSNIVPSTYCEALGKSHKSQFFSSAK